MAAMIPIGGQLATVGKLGMKAADATNVVYRWIDKSGAAKSLLDYQVIPGATNMTRLDARIMEQTFINQYGLGNLLNKRNSKSPKYWEQYGIKWLKDG